MLAFEDGPWDVLYRFRMRIEGNTLLSNLMDCPGCSSVWISFIISAIVWGFTSNYVINSLALSAVTVIITNILGDKDGKDSA
jgi:hypothetical protein